MRTNKNKPNLDLPDENLESNLDSLKPLTSKRKEDLRLPHFENPALTAFADRPKSKSHRLAKQFFRFSYEIGLTLTLVILATVYMHARDWVHISNAVTKTHAIQDEILPLANEILTIRTTTSDLAKNSKISPDDRRRAFEKIESRVQAQFQKISMTNGIEPSQRQLLDNFRDLFTKTFEVIKNAPVSKIRENPAEDLLISLQKQRAALEAEEEKQLAQETMNAQNSTKNFGLLFILETMLALFLWILSRTLLMRHFREIAEQQHALRKAQHDAELASRYKSTFLANLSHEIRTPMNAVLGMANILLRTNPRPDQIEYCETIRQSGRTLLRILQDTLDLSRIEAGKIKLDMMPFDPRKLLLTVGDIIRPSLKDVVRLKLDVSERVPRVCIGDAGRIQQILLNLSSNAAKFTDEGEIHLAIGFPPNESYRDGLLAQMIRFEVKDTGLGIPEAAISRLFEPFAQVSPESPREKQGTGLGLSICKRFVELMQGQIGVESREGTGSRFYFDIPLESRDSTQELLDKQDEPSSGFELNSSEDLHFEGRALVVDDNLANLKVAELTLRSLGFEVTICKSGIEALQILPQGFDVIFMDCQMPEMDGFETTRHIRTAEGKARHTPVVALTAHASQETLDKCIREGMDDFLVKPLDFEHLQAVVGRFITPTMPNFDEVKETSRASEKTLASSDGTLSNRSTAQSPVAQNENSLEYAAATPKKSAPKIDYEILKSLQRLVPPRGEFNSSTDVIDELIRLFASSTERSIAKLHRLVDENNSIGFAEEAHYLKSSSTSIGAVAVTRELETMEKLKGVAQLPDNTEERLAALETECKLALDELRNWWSRENPLRS